MKILSLPATYFNRLDVISRMIFETY